MFLTKYFLTESSDFKNLIDLKLDIYFKRRILKMDEKEFLREKEKLKEVSNKLEEEEKVIESNLSTTSTN